MKFVQFHLGDWLSGTHLLSATERGVYFDLIVQYYIQEGPLMQMQCKRIENAYAQPERDALHFVLSTFFTFRDGAFYHERCEAEISAFKAKSVKRKSAANARWEREKRKSDENEAPGSRDADADADALQMQSNSNPSGLLTNNHKPVSKRDIYTPSEIESGDVDLKAAFADWKRVRKAKRHR